MNKTLTTLRTVQQQKDYTTAALQFRAGMEGVDVINDMY